MISRTLTVLLALTVAATACTSGNASDDASTPTTATPSTESTVPVEVDQIDSEGQRLVPEEEKPDLEVALIWHQHQPRYPVIDGAISRPWVRLHASKDYLDMATIVQEFPELALTINLTPVLLDQLVDLEEGANDSYEDVSRTPLQDLTPDRRRFIVDRFFDINSKIIDRSDRFGDLRELRETGVDFDDQALRDLRTLFHLGWIDPEIVEGDPALRALRDDDGGFTDADTITVLDAIDALVAQVLPTHAELWNSGQIEVTTSPLAHPILPLIADTDLASIGDPTAILPREPFREPADAEAQVQRGLERANELLGQTPNGMWPGEGAVAQAVMPIFAQNDVAWVASGEDVLAQSLGNGGFSRDVNDTVIDAVDLYKPYTVSTASGEVDMFFRDVRLSDLIGFEYSNLDADLAAADLMNRLDEIRSQLARSGLTATSGETPVVTLVIDGENAWENYPNDGRDFLRAMYGAFTSTPWLKTTTPSAYLTDHPTATDSLEEVYPAAWFSPNFATWIGEPEEARAWELLRLARIDLADADRRGSASSEQLAAATNLMYQAQGSDWFWWYGDDQDSGNDRYFDNAFRELLGQMYDALGQARPRWTSVPIIPDPRVVPISSTGEPITVRIDGNPADFLDAANFDFAIDGDVITTLAVAVDENRVGMLFEGGYDDGMDIYIGAPGGVRQRGTTIDDRFVLGFDATHLIRWNEREGACISSVLAPETVINSYPQTCERLESALSASGVELAIPNEILGQLTAGDRLNIRIQTGSSLSPSSGPAESPIPDIANFDEIRQFSDAGGDDHGPGSYTYPTDRVFVPGSFDLREVVVGESGPTPEDDVVFSFLLDTPIDNPFNSPIGLSLQSIDLYLDYDPGAGTGRQALLNGRNASLAVGNGWEAAIAIEGWESAIAVPRGASYTEVDSGFAVSVLAEQGLVTLRIPRRSLPAGLDLRTAGVGVAVMAQEGFPSPGVRRIRNVAPTASQWEFGGGNSGGGDTRIIDALTPGDQGSLLAENVLPLNLP